MSRRKDERGHWYLLTGLLLGLAAGLVYAWIIQPVEYVDTSPASLRSDFKDQYRALIAAAYVANGDLVRAEARLKLLGDKDLYRTLSEQAQRTLAQDSASSEARALGLLAIAIGQGSGLPPAASEIPSASPPPGPTATASAPPSATPVPTATPPPPSATSQPEPTTTGLPRPTDTAAPTRPPSATPGRPFVLESRQPVCEQKLSQPLIIIEASNAAGQPVAGVLVIVTLVGGSGEERFYTGLKPEKGLGYADFTPSPGKTYTLRLGEAGELISDLAALECKDASGAAFWGAWLLRFVQK